MAAHRRNCALRDEVEHDTGRCERSKGHAPTAERSDVERQRYPNNGRERKTHHYQAHCATAPRVRHTIADHRENNGALHTAEQTCHGASHQKREIGGCERAADRANNQPAVGDHECALAVESIRKRCHQQARHRGGQRIGRHKHTELRCRDVEIAHQMRRQRHHHHEVNYVGEAHCHEQHQPALLGACVVGIGAGSGYVGGDGGI
jgi:hypothetical protein